MQDAQQQSDSDSKIANATINADYSTAIDQVDRWVDGAITLIPNFTVALVVLLVFFILGSLARFLIRRQLNRRQRSNLGDMLGGLVKWSLILLGFLLAATIVMPSLKPGDLIAGLGVGSVAIGFAFKDILQNWLAGLLILIRQPFEVGDQIKVADYEGTVCRIETRATMIDTYDGQRVVIPNSDIYTNAILVKTAHATRRTDYDIGIGYSDDIEEACTVICKALNQVEGVLSEPAPEALPWELAASWVSIRARWWTHAKQSDVTHVRARVIHAIKIALDDAGIDMPFETQVHLFHDQTDESDGERGSQREGWPVGRKDRE
ncbi:mechanosensitive ion channel family protein [Microbulbifer sp. CAU 1566]|uniref:mechanosensitive ion channel family protein n=1 Tax=Microbulbifer sp. CAU 1566 TaxID=2933269 RepID=UPI0020030265|nr:mechanosensitive ion channel family protein [Microbulbifer sp. CAU 1566]MCK7597154.1 mechanosensitive ion channel family protein [Microbulbifer sp. CAU 1566]